MHSSHDKHSARKQYTFLPWSCTVQVMTLHGNNASHLGCAKKLIVSFFSRIEIRCGIIIIIIKNNITGLLSVCCHSTLSLPCDVISLPSRLSVCIFSLTPTTNPWHCIAHTILFPLNTCWVYPQLILHHKVVTLLLLLVLFHLFLFLHIFFYVLHARWLCGDP